MTDENLNAENSVESQQADSFSQNLESPVSQQTPEMVPAKTQEKYVSQSEVNNLISAEKKKAYEKGVQSANQKFSQSQTQQPIQAYDQGVSIDQRVDTLLNQKLSEMQRQNQEVLHKQQQDTFFSKVEGSFKQNMDSAREEIEGFDEALESVGNFDQFRGVKLAASQFEKSGKVLHYLAENPQEIPGIEQLARLQKANGEPNMAPVLKVFKRIHDSIALNDNAKKSPRAPNPISQIQTNSKDGIGDASESSLEDFKAKFRT